MSEANGDNLDCLVDNLDGIQIDHYGINKCAAFDHGKPVIWLTVYATDNHDDEFDEQLSFTPQGLVDFCTEIIRIANLQRIVGPDVPPTDDAGRWERSKSPWHADAFPDEFKDRAPEQGGRKTGWLEIDWCGNAIGWVPDGTVTPAPEAIEAWVNKCKKFERELNEARQALSCIQEWAENFPSGGVGPEGSTQDDLDAASAEGRACENDATYHCAQQIWLIAERAKAK